MEVATVGPRTKAIVSSAENMGVKFHGGRMNANMCVLARLFRVRVWGSDRVHEICEPCGSSWRRSGWDVGPLIADHALAEETRFQMGICRYWYPGAPFCRKYPAILVPCGCGRREALEDAAAWGGAWEPYDGVVLPE